jgi:cytochrome c-type biogenesis protein CcmH/NrfG
MRISFLTLRPWVILWSLCAAGCVPLEQSPRQALEPPFVIVESTVTKAAREAFRTRDTVYAEQLLQLADDVDAGLVKFDAKLKQRLAESQTKASDAANPGLSKVIASEFGPNALTNPAKVSQSLRDIAKALESIKKN